MNKGIKFTPLTGALNENPLCYLLQIDEANILLDCGWNDRMDSAVLESVLKLKSIDAIVISHGDMPHIGALPYVYSKLGLSCPVYCTIPTQNMGLITCYEAFHSRKHNEAFDLFSLDDVDHVFDRVTQLRYSQPFLLAGKCSGVVLTAFPSGRSIGGTCWKIVKDNDEIIYAVDYNHKKERHINGTILHLGLDHLVRPTILITDARNAKSVQTTRQARDQELFKAIKETIGNRGSVLIPTDASIRILELSYLLDKYWTMNNMNIPLYFLSYHGTNTINVAKSMLEWLGDSLTLAFSQRREAPFYFQHLQLVHSIDEIQLSEPSVILCATNSMDEGWSNELFLHFSTNQLNRIILTEVAEPDTIARKLYQEWSNHKESLVQMDFELELLVKQKQVAPVVEQVNEPQVQVVETNEIVEDQDEDMQDINRMATNQYDFYVMDQVKSSQFFKQASSFFMFPVHDFKQKYDDYGELIDAQLFMQGEYVEAIEQQPEIEDDKETRLHRYSDNGQVTYSSTQVKLPIKCLVMYIDFEGRSDGQSVRNIIQKVQPKKLVLVHGSSECTQELADFCTEHVTDQVFTPQELESLVLTEASNVFQLKLTDSLMTSIQLKSIKDVQVGLIHGVVCFPEEADQETSMAMLDMLPANKQKLLKPVILGDLKLAEFRKILEKHDFGSEFYQGVLVLPEHGLVLRKNMQGHLSLEGRLSSAYYKIRELLYEQHVLL